MQLNIESLGKKYRGSVWGLKEFSLKTYLTTDRTSNGNVSNQPLERS